MSCQQIAVPQQCPDREGDVSMHIPRAPHAATPLPGSAGSHKASCLWHRHAGTHGAPSQVLHERPVPGRHFGGAVPTAQMGTPLLGSP